MYYFCISIFFGVLRPVDTVDMVATIRILRGIVAAAGTGDCSNRSNHHIRPLTLVNELSRHKCFAIIPRFH